MGSLVGAGAGQKICAFPPQPEPKSAIGCTIMAPPLAVAEAASVSSLINNGASVSHPGTGALVAGWRGQSAMRKGGLGSATATVDGGVVGALVVVNAVGDIFTLEGESLTGGPPIPGPPQGAPRPMQATTLVAVATDLAFSRTDLQRLAVRAHDAIGACVRPAHTRYDGDVVFAVSCGSAAGSIDAAMEATFHAVGAAIEAAVRHATSVPGAPAIEDRAGEPEQVTLPLNGDAAAPPVTGGDASPEDGSGPERLARLAAEAAGCTQCRLSEARTQVVFGIGDPEADLMFVGEAPGQREDELGEPFVGRSGQLLDQLLGEIGLRRADVYIANVVKCRPPGNRDPRQDEIDACKGYLREQLRLIDPKVVVTLGNFASKLLLNTTTGITRLRGQAYPWWNRRLVPTYHPAAALRGSARVLEEMRSDFLVASQLLESDPQ